MEKSILNEVNKMRKLMGLNENIFNTPQMGGVTNSKGTAGYIDNTSKMDKEYADSLKSKDDKAIEQVVHDIFKNDVITDKSEVEDIITQMRRDWLSKKGADENIDVYGFIKSYMDSYIQGANDHVSMSDEKWGWSENETDNSIYGQYANSIVDQAIEDAKGDEMYESTNGNADGSDSVGIITSNGKLMAGYFQEFGLISAGDTILFDNEGKLVKRGGGYPSSGFKDHEDAKELEKDICNNYEEILDIFRQTAPKVVNLNEGYNVIKKAVECDLVY